MNAKNKKLFLSENGISFFLIIIILAIWELASRLNMIETFFTSRPSDIFTAGFGLVRSGEIFPHLFYSAKILSIGFTSAVVVGYLAGVFIGFNNKLYFIFKPYIFSLNALPIIVIMPLIILWFGIGEFSKIFMVFLLSMKPVLINSIEGSRQVDENFLKMAHSFEVGKASIFKNIYIYSTLPFMFAGAKVATGMAIVGMVIAEFFGYGKGLGFLASYYGMTFKSGKLMFVILLLFLLNICILKIISLIERYFVRWKIIGS